MWVDGDFRFNWTKEIGEDKGLELRSDRQLETVELYIDPTDIITRIIPLGYGDGEENQLTIKNVNGGLDYLQAQQEFTDKYGIVEIPYTDKNIQNAYTLKQKGQFVLDENKSPKVYVKVRGVDPSVLTRYQDEHINLGDTRYIRVQRYDVRLPARVVSITRDLDEPWRFEAELDNRTINLSDDTLNLYRKTAAFERAPQGATNIYTMPFADNVAPDFPITLPLNIPDSAVNINDVKVKITGQKFRYYTTGAANGGGSQKSSGASSRNHNS